MHFHLYFVSELFPTNFGICVQILVTNFIPSNFILVTKVRFLDFVILVHIQGSQSMDFHFCLISCMPSAFILLIQTQL